MKFRLRFILALVAALALLSGAALLWVQDATRVWFERDIGLRAELAVNGLRQALLVDLPRRNLRSLRQLLTDITRDERIIAAAVCGPKLETLVQTERFPAEFGCERISASVGAVPGWQIWKTAREIAGGPAHASAIPLRDDTQTPIGAIVLVHDLSFVARREAQTGRFLLAAFGVLALMASVVTLVAIRLSWRGWSDELRRMARGETDTRRREFLPLLKDMRELLDRLATEEEAELRGGTWTPERLRLTLRRHLHGERVIVVANRAPYLHVRGDDGALRVLHPASGLVTALEPVMRACSGVWVAHGAGNADRETADARGRIRMPPEESSYWLRRVWLTPEEERGYYYGLSNEGLWPLCHVAHTRPAFRAEDWQHYQAVNRKFADAVLDEVEGEDPVILVQDYHFALLPKLLRERLPRATIITFWHIPWPNAEQLGICPWRNELLEGLLGSSIIGFHTQHHCNNFLDAADRFLESRIDREAQAVVQNRSSTLVRAYPISVSWPNPWAGAAPPVAECRAALRAELNLPDDCRIGVGVDRLDYTKGIEERLRAVERLFERRPDLIGRFCFVQIASPSRTAIERYDQLNRDVEGLVIRINQRFGREGWQPIVLRRVHTEPAEVFRLYRAADLCYVSSVHDGMNLVAKEFVAARDDEQGVLLLSRFTGAARELTEALLVNPYDLEEASAALIAALEMSPAEQRERMHAMRTLVSEFNVYRWAGRMLLDAGRLRRRQQLAGRLLTEPVGEPRP
ncbi:MAG: trehalose-6-phosphate synthase [Pseudomonadota bacterium]